jgi:hypothetical protein
VPYSPCGHYEKENIPFPYQETELRFAGIPARHRGTTLSELRVREIVCHLQQLVALDSLIIPATSGISFVHQ